MCLRRGGVAVRPAVARSRHPRSRPTKRRCCLLKNPFGPGEVIQGRIYTCEFFRFCRRISTLNVTEAAAGDGEFLAEDVASDSDRDPFRFECFAVNHSPEVFPSEQEITRNAENEKDVTYDLCPANSPQ